ncbi:hypothetical protein [Clostridium beijerinckii]|nr:hypothetical protein [Clostridium beijerinckii]MBC2458498.1 hypothetical protein [Clostridium beijerinckii]MBC2475920.1 hypothetical protein [Clostridium beijerinckii]NOV61573.1 hypothetical protein [Clostridium beijerinckii]NOV68931.1 hypothetical protein [Clostridium beijerinckii]NOW34955.1 hypothetical protein [Clostridium beijerinckii]
MLKAILKPVEKILTNKFNKPGLKGELSKHPDYISKAREIWDMIDEDFGISSTIENVLKLKIDKFDNTLISKFPELKKEDIEELKQNILENLNLGKDFTFGNAKVIKELNDINSKLQEENEKLKSELRKFESLLTSSSNSNLNEAETAANKDEK